MLKLILRVLFLAILGLLAYDIALTGSFNKSQTYRFLTEKLIIQNAEGLMKQAKKSYDKATVWAEENIPTYYNHTCFYFKPFLNLGQELLLVFKSNAVSLIKHTGIYVDKNLPIFQNYMSVLLKDTISLAKLGALVVSKHLQNYAETVIQFANNILNQR